MSELTDRQQTLLSVNPWLIHRNQDCFGVDAETYNPERWLGDADKVRQMEKYLIPVSAFMITCLVMISNSVGRMPPHHAFSLDWATMPAPVATSPCWS